MSAATAAREVAFQYKYVVGYCKTKHHGTGPTLQMKVGDREVWKHQINLTTGDFPYDKNCGGYPHNYSPEQKAVFTIPAGVGGDVKLYMIVKDRNIHVVGSGLKCADDDHHHEHGYGSGGTYTSGGPVVHVAPSQQLSQELNVYTSAKSNPYASGHHEEDHHEEDHHEEDRHEEDHHKWWQPRRGHHKWWHGMA